MSADSMTELLEKDAVRDVIQRSAQLLDDEALKDWLELFAEDGTYEIGAYGAEIRSEMIWWRSSRTDLGKILNEAREHVRDPAKRLHMVTSISVKLSGDRAEALSHFQVTRTDPDGVSSLYVTGRYKDRLTKQNGSWLYASHKAVLDTRMLDVFTHLPL